MTTHAIKRAAERYGVILDAPTIAAIGKDIDAGRAVLLRKQENGTEQCIVMTKGVALKIIWAPATRCIVTVLSRKRASCAEVRRCGWKRRRE